MDYDNSGGMPELISAFAADRNASTVEELIIGAFDFEGGDSSPIVESLVSNASRLPNLRVLFIGDITYEENEISWINQSDISHSECLAEAGVFPRGGNSLAFNGGLHHNNLRFLIIESGGLPPSVIETVSKAKLPALEHLELLAWRMKTWLNSFRKTSL